MKIARATGKSLKRMKFSNEANGKELDAGCLRGGRVAAGKWPMTNGLLRVCLWTKAKKRARQTTVEMWADFENWSNRRNWRGAPERQPDPMERQETQLSKESTNLIHSRPANDAAGGRMSG